MGRQHSIPLQFASPLIASIKQARRRCDPKKQDCSPTFLDFGPFTVKLARHFGFCFGVEHAIDVAYRALAEHPKRRVFLLGEMIHNPIVNGDLAQAGVQFLRLSQEADSWAKVIQSLTPDDVVIVPAFGTTVEIQNLLVNQGIDPYTYDTTCPFVEKVWRCAERIGKRGFTIAIHGKSLHEETLATFSHAQQYAPIIVLANSTDAEFLVEYLKDKRTTTEFWQRFRGCTSQNFDPIKDLKHLGIVHQTTMLASETQRITDVLKNGMSQIFGEDNLSQRLADTRDTLCYATADNQKSTMGLIEDGADLVLVVGGYNSSNTSHLVEMCKTRIPTYYIKDAAEILSAQSLRHYSIQDHQTVTSKGWLPEQQIGAKAPIIGLTSGASCPDRTVEDVIERLCSLHKNTKSLDILAEEFKKINTS